MIVIANTLQITYQAMPAKKALVDLNFTSKTELLTFLKTEMKWTEVTETKDGLITVPLTKDNSMKATVLQENIKFEREFYAVLLIISSSWIELTKILGASYGK